MQCPNCQHWNEAGSRFCEECGFELPASNTTAYQVPIRPVGATESAPVAPTAPADASQVPDPPQQDLTPVDTAPPAPYAGPHLLLNSTGSIFKLGSAAVIGREDPALQIDFE